MRIWRLGKETRAAQEGVGLTLIVQVVSVVEGRPLASLD